MLIILLGVVSGGPVQSRLVVAIVAIGSGIVREWPAGLLSGKPQGWRHLREDRVPFPPLPRLDRFVDALGASLSAPATLWPFFVTFLFLQEQ